MEMSLVEEAEQEGHVAQMQAGCIYVYGLYILQVSAQCHTRLGQNVCMMHISENNSRPSWRAHYGISACHNNNGLQQRCIVVLH